jgi:hypothetical protein
MHIIRVTNHIAINADHILKADYYPTGATNSETTKIVLRFTVGDEIEFTGEDADRLWRTLTGQGPPESRFDMTES